MADLQIRVGLGTHEIILYKYCPPYADAGAFAYPLLYSHLDGPGGNWLMLNDPQVDAIITESQAAQDALLREKKFQQLSEYLEENALLVFVGYSTPSISISNRLAGLQLGPYDFDASLPGQDFSKLGVRSELSPAASER
jgi:ABC-type transport system substrate-binding protein